MSMRAIAFTYKSKIANVINVTVPEPSADEVLVKVCSSALDTALDPVVNKTTLGGFLHKLTDPLLCGWHFSGVVSKKGTEVSEIQIGDNVFGHLPYDGANAQGSLSEYITIKSSSCSLKPESISHDIAAAASVESLTALQALRDEGGLKENGRQEVLINGAGGAVGYAAVQIAKRMGANTTAVCSTKDVEKVKNAGATTVIDRKKVQSVFSEFQRSHFDIVFDTPDILPIGKSLSLLKPRGVYVTTGFRLGMLWGKFVSMFARKPVKMVLVQSRDADLKLLGEWLEGGFKTDIDSTFLVKDIEAAAEKNRDKSKQGRVVVHVLDGW